MTALSGEEFVIPLGMLYTLLRDAIDSLKVSPGRGAPGAQLTVSRILVLMVTARVALAAPGALLVALTVQLPTDCPSSVTAPVEALTVQVAGVSDE